jgi:hypothetical protein
MQMPLLLFAVPNKKEEHTLHSVNPLFLAFF